MKTTLAALVLLGALPVPAGADRADDDLQAVRKAVAASAAVAQARPPAEQPPAAADEARPAPRKGEPQWFRVNIVEKAGKRAKVKIDLPLALVRTSGDDWPLGIDRGCCLDFRH